MHDVLHALADHQAIVKPRQISLDGFNALAADIQGPAMHRHAYARSPADQLLDEIRGLISARDDLAGKPAADYAELLSLADKTKTDGSKTSYAYNVLSGGDVQEPSQAIIIVGDGKILQAGWPHGEY